MRTLPSNIQSNYLLQGNRPRVLLSLADSGKYWATEDYNSYSDRIYKSRILRQAIDPEGGMSFVSNTDISVLKLGESVQFHRSASLAPKMQGTLEGAGRLAKLGSSIDTYAMVRGSGTASLSDTSIDVGQQKSGYHYYLYRGYMQYELPSGLTSCEDAYISLAGAADFSDTDVNLVLVAGTWSILNSGIYDEFSGWESGDTQYTGQVLSETFSTANFSTDNANMIRLNAAGLDYIESAMDSDGIVRFMLLSYNDYQAQEPTGDEMVRFRVSADSESPRLVLQYNTVRPENRTAKIYLAFEDRYYGMPDGEAYMLTLWTGVVDRYRLNEETIDLQLFHDDYRNNSRVPADILETDTFPNLHEDLVGEPYPVVYGRANPDLTGRHLNYIGIEDSLGAVSGLQRYFKFPVISQGDEDYNNPMQVLLGSHELDRAISGYPAIWSEGLKGYCRLWGTVGNDIDAGDYQYVEITPRGRLTQELAPSTTNYEEDFFGIAASIIPSGVYDYSDTLTPAAAYDEIGAGAATLQNANAYVEYSFGKIGSAGDIDKVEVVFDLDDNHGTPGTNFVKVKLLDKHKANISEGNDGITTDAGTDSQFTSAGASFAVDGVAAGDMLVILSGLNKGRYRIKSRDSATVLTTEKMAYTQSNQTYKVIQQSAATLFEKTLIYGTGQRIIDMTELDTGGMVGWDLQDKLLRIEYDYESGTAATFEISNLQVRVFAFPDEPIRHVYFDARGREDDGSGSITGTAGDVIECPPHVIRALPYHEAGLPVSRINTSSFTTAATDLSGWAFSLQQEDRDYLFRYYGAKGLLNELGKQCKSHIYRDYLNRLKIAVYDATAGFAHSGTDVPDDLDIIEYDGSPSGGSFTRHGILPGSYLIEPIEIDRVKNDFILHYGLNPANGTYEHTLHMTSGEGDADSVDTNIDDSHLENSRTLDELMDLCAGSYNRIQMVSADEYEAFAIRDEQTATRLLQHRIEWYTKLRRFVEVDTGLNALCFEVGDFVNIRTPELYAEYGTATTEAKKWMVVEHDIELNEFTIHMKLIEV